VNAQVVLYADTITDSMKRAMDETERRRALQLAYNEKAWHHARDGAKRACAADWSRCSVLARWPQKAVQQSAEQLERGRGDRPATSGHARRCRGTRLRAGRPRLRDRIQEIEAQEGPGHSPRQRCSTWISQSGKNAKAPRGRRKTQPANVSQDRAAPVRKRKDHPSRDCKGSGGRKNRAATVRERKKQETEPRP
jgi:hypothetical protein